MTIKQILKMMENVNDFNELVGDKKEIILV
jgi:hypothetical protein